MRKKSEKKIQRTKKRAAEKLKKLAKKEILELRGALEETPITPDSQTYIQIYEAVKSLYFCEKYRLAAEISWMLKMELIKRS